MPPRNDRWSTLDIPDQSGRTALITGANSGLGLETARALAERGARVVLACRSLERAEQTRQELAATARGELETLELDLADQASVAAAAEAVSRRHTGLDLLINNAGVMALPRTLTPDGFECQLGTNHLGHFRLTLALLPLLEGRSDARVVTVSSGAHHFGRIDFEDLQGERNYYRWRAYAQSKLANVMFALELQRLLEARGSRILSLVAHPGMANTNLQPRSLAATGDRADALGVRLLEPLFQSAAMGALPQLYAATAPDVRGGEMIGPDGLAELRGWPRRARIAPAARKADQRRRLWECSARLCGLSDEEALLTVRTAG